MSEEKTTTESWEAENAFLATGSRKQLPEKLSTLRQKLYRKARQEPRDILATVNALGERL